MDTSLRCSSTREDVSYLFFLSSGIFTLLFFSIIGASFVNPVFAFSLLPIAFVSGMFFFLPLKVIGWKSSNVLLVEFTPLFFVCLFALYVCNIINAYVLYPPAIFFSLWHALFLITCISGIGYGIGLFKTMPVFGFQSYVAAVSTFSLISIIGLVSLIAPFLYIFVFLFLCIHALSLFAILTKAKDIIAI